MHVLRGSVSAQYTQAMRNATSASDGDYTRYAIGMVADYLPEHFKTLLHAAYPFGFVSHLAFVIQIHFQGPRSCCQRTGAARR